MTESILIPKTGISSTKTKELFNLVRDMNKNHEILSTAIKLITNSKNKPVFENYDVVVDIQVGRTEILAQSWEIGKKDYMKWITQELHPALLHVSMKPLPYGIDKTDTTAQILVQNYNDILNELKKLRIKCNNIIHQKEAPKVDRKKLVTEAINNGIPGQTGEELFKFGWEKGIQDISEWIDNIINSK